MQIEFTPDELRKWARAGVDRRVNAIEKQRRGAHGFNRKDFWQLDIEGVLAEAAVAKALGLDEWEPVVGQLDTELGDVMSGLQVRSTWYAKGNLLIHETDADDDKFVLVTGAAPTYMIRGWCHGRDGKKPELWKTVSKGQTSRSAYWVPQDKLARFLPSQILAGAA